MGFIANLKGQQAYAQHARGNMAQAQALYAQAFDGGLNKPKLLMGYAILLLRSGQYQRAVDVLKRTEKAPGITPDMKRQMLSHYAVAIWRLGNLPRAIEVLEELYHKQKNGLVYGTLGFIYIEQGDVEKALAFNQEAVAYDDSDAVFLDNLAQTLYRLKGDKAGAKPFFEKALALKPGAIDTNYFLAQYDLEAGDREAAMAKLETALAGKFSPLNHRDAAQIQAELDALRGESEG